MDSLNAHSSLRTETSDDDISARSEHDTLAKVTEHKYKGEHGGTVISESEISAQKTQSVPNIATWKQTWLRFGPLTGLLALLLTIASILASLVVLIVSDRSPTSSWKFSPSVYLGIATATANPAIRYASLQGVIIAWWTRASKGTTFSKLHTDWFAGTSLVGAIASGRSLGFLGLACIMASLVVVDGPLLQSSSSVVSAAILNHELPLNITLAPEVPTGYTGQWFRRNISESGVCDTYFGRDIPTPFGHTKNDICSIFGDNMMNVAESVKRDAPLDGVVSGCTHNCRAKIKAPALMVSSCASQYIQLNLSQPWDENELDTKSMMKRTSFVKSVQPNNGHERLNLITGYAKMDQADEDCTGTFNLTTCLLDSAIGLYDVDISKDKLVVHKPIRPTIIEIANNTLAGPSDHHGTLHSTLMGLQALFSTQESAVNQALGWKPITFSSAGALVPYVTSTQAGCLSFKDPWQDSMETLNEYMFHIGVLATHTFDSRHLAERLDSGLEETSTVNGAVVGSQSVFSTDYAYFAGAALIQLLCIIFILPTYWGWWHFGRKISFSPLEMAKAFDSPLLADCDSNSSGSQVAKVMDDKRVRYTALVDDAGNRTTRNGIGKFCFTNSDSGETSASKQLRA